jgi:hypothetical protein
VTSATPAATSCAGLLTCENATLQMSRIWRRGALACGNTRMIFACAVLVP